MFQENLEQSVIKYTKGKYSPLTSQARHTSATVVDLVCETSSLHNTTETGVQGTHTYARAVPTQQPPPSQDLPTLVTLGASPPPWVVFWYRLQESRRPDDHLAT